MSISTYDVIVIGAGQAGLAAGYFLKKTALSFLLLDKNVSVGQSWKERYDSLKLFTPNAFNSLPGLDFPAAQNEYSMKNDIMAYLQTYAKKFNLPIHLQTKVTKLEKKDTSFTLMTNHATYSAQNIIVATGHFQSPYIPAFASSVNSSVFQLHTATYKNPSQIPDGKVLIVGMGNSGAQIAVELSQSHEVTIASRSRPKYLFYPSLSKKWFWLIIIPGLFLLSKSTTQWPVNALVEKIREPIIGSDGKKLKQLLQSNRVKLKPAAIGAVDNFVQFSDNSREQFTTIIWATGFKDDFSWINIQGSVDAKGKPIQKQGVSPITGLYFVGLKYQTTFGSGFINGTGNDARYITRELLKNKIVQ